MNLFGLSDSLAGVTRHPAACPACGGTIRVSGDGCVQCLLHAGLDEFDLATGEPDTFDAVLAGIGVQDKDWRLGNYQILEEIGRGGMGVIYRARQRHSRRIVALKRVLSYHGDSRDTLERFRREAQAAASLDHPNILPIYEVGETEGLPFFTMKFAPGGSLQQAGAVLSSEPRECVRLVAKVARAVAYAHTEGILHRDLKPGNILLDARGEPLVSDFGLAKWIDATNSLTRSLTIFGTPGYIAPEQANASASSLTPRADVYSLGAILFDLLTGRPPFLGEHALAVIRQASEQEAPKLRSIRIALDRDLETICARCLERDPEARYQSAADVAEDLERWLEGRSIVARPVSAPAHVWRWARRNRPLAATLAAAVLLAGLVVGRQVRVNRQDATLRDQAIATRSIAVLPFLNLDTAEASERIANDIAKALQTELSRSGPARITVLSAAGSWPVGSGNLQDLTEANRETKARAILTGTERVVNGKLRLSIRLINPATGDVLLTRLLELSPTRDVAAEVVRTLQREIDMMLSSADWSGASVAARDPGLRNEASRSFIVAGRDLTLRDSAENVEKAIGVLEKALQIEPNSAIARAYLASAIGYRLYYKPDPSLLERAVQEANLAVQLAPDSPDTHRALAGVLYHKRLFAEAFEEQLRAVEANGPEEVVVGFIGMILERMGKPDRALSWLALTPRRETRPGTYCVLIGHSWSVLGADGRAEAAFQRSRDLRPESSHGWVGLCRLRVLQGDMAAARAVADELQERFKGAMNADEMAANAALFVRDYRDAERLFAALMAKAPDGGMRPDSTISYAAGLGLARRATGDEEVARHLLERALARERAELQSAPGMRSSLYRLAAVEASLGDRHSALEHLSAAVDAGWVDYRWLQVDPQFDALQPDQRFQEIIVALKRAVGEMRRKAEKSQP